MLKTLCCPSHPASRLALALLLDPNDSLLAPLYAQADMACELIAETASGTHTATGRMVVLK